MTVQNLTRASAVLALAADQLAAIGADETLSEEHAAQLATLEDAVRAALELVVDGGELLEELEADAAIADWEREAVGA